MKKDFRLELKQLIDQLGDNEPVLIAEIQRMLAEAQLLATETKGSQPFAQLLSNEILNQLNAEGKAPLIATGFSSFDKKFGGFALGEYIILGSRPSVGKTQMLIDFSLHISKEMPLAFFTNSMSELLLRQRFLATIQNLPIENVVQQNLTQEEKHALSLLDLNSYKMHINKCQGSNTALFFQECKRLVVEDAVKVIVLDDIQHLSNTTYRREKEFEINLISRQIKNFALEHQVCFIVSSQLNRGLETRQGSKLPQLYDMRDSGALEQDADKVMFLYRPEYYGIDDFTDKQEGETHWHLIKNQTGPNGVLRLMMNELKNRFSEIENEEQSPNGFLFTARLNEFK